LWNRWYAFPHKFILSTPFLTQIYTFTINESAVHTKILDKQTSFNFLSAIKQRKVSLLQNSSICKQVNILQLKQTQITYLHDELSYKRIQKQLQNPSTQTKILDLQQIFKRTICSDLPNAFWEWKKHIISLSYEKDFDEQNIPTKARPTQINSELHDFCKKEIQNLIDKRLIRLSKSPWSCAAFHVNDMAERERGVPRVVINYEPLNKVLQWIRYPIPNKRDLLNRLSEAKIFLRFDMKSGF